MFKCLLVLGGLGMSLVGCGSGGTSGSNAPPLPATPTNASWAYTALGDSLAVGVLASQGYVPHYEHYLSVDKSVTVQLTDLGRDGWTSEDLLAAVRSDDLFRKAIGDAQVVTWDIGGNDLLRARREYLSGTCGGSDNQDCLRSAHFVREDRAAARFLTLNSYVQVINQHIAASATQNGVPFAKVSVAFTGPNGDQDPVSAGYISLDGVHPNDAGHKVIADLLRQLGYDVRP